MLDLSAHVPRHGRIRFILIFFLSFSLSLAASVAIFLELNSLQNKKDEREFFVLLKKMANSLLPH